MPRLAVLARKPAGLAHDSEFGSWFASVAEHLLNAYELVANGAWYRLAELEVYYHGPGHPDPFAHRDPLQFAFGRWYFHRTGGTHRGGTFKGLDLTFGDGQAAFGVLLRAVKGPEGALIEGPCRTVDALLKQTRTTTVAELDSRIARRDIWDSTSPLYVRELPVSSRAEIYRTARVGLRLPSGGPDADEKSRYLMQPYRFLTEPRVLRKGRPQLVRALHHRGWDSDAIHALTGVPYSAIARHIAKLGQTL